MFVSVILSRNNSAYLIVVYKLTTHTFSYFLMFLTYQKWLLRYLSCFTCFLEHLLKGRHTEPHKIVISILMQFGLVVMHPHMPLCPLHRGGGAPRQNVWVGQISGTFDTRQ